MELDESPQPKLLLTPGSGKPHSNSQWVERVTSGTEFLELVVRTYNSRRDEFIGFAERENRTVAITSDLETSGEEKPQPPVSGVRIDVGTTFLYVRLRIFGKNSAGRAPREVRETSVVTFLDEYFE
ncbi:hypothetical protein FFI94_030945 [Rhodococcus sp. KBS0724]|uniref:hypothetical protein n=1 Tax=Rhodococcus sp. KBS0724 TaxID=1179674 RepID=UPI001186B17A|nr:hypothetical protein [Rhodococcus sp. KBS0724]TSD40205.1 hypothetical protein FFI94_030945 [Rhodococcus sp. KBS0724]